MHLGLVDDDGAVVAISTWIDRPFPDSSPRAAGCSCAAWPSTRRDRGRGTGAVLVAAGLERAAAQGADVVWANARDTALGFYARHGFAVVGDGFVDPTTGLPHHRIVRTVS